MFQCRTLLIQKLESFKNEQHIIKKLRVRHRKENMMDKRLQCGKKETVIDDDEGTSAMKITNNDAPVFRMFLNEH